MVIGMIYQGAVVRAEDGGDMERLKRQVTYLGEALATAKAEVDALKAQLDERTKPAARGTEIEAPGAAVREKEYRVLDVNDELGMVILDGGRRDGLKPGLLFAIIEQGRAVAKVRIVDVRTAVAGAVVQDVSLGFPKVLDRAVLVTGSRK